MSVKGQGHSLNLVKSHSDFIVNTCFSQKQLGDLEPKFIWKLKCVCVCVLQFSYRRYPSGSAVRNHCRTHPEPCVRPRCICSVLRARVQFCRFDKADATADVQWHCNHRPPLWYHLFPAQSSLGADILVCWIGKIVRKAEVRMGMIIYTNELGHMTNMATMPIYGKNCKNIFFSRSNRPMTLKLCM